MALPRLLPALQAGAELWRRQADPDLAEAGERLARWLEAGAGDLGDALGLRPEPGGRHWRTTAALIARDTALRTAAERFGVDAAGLHAALLRYAGTAWPRERQAPCCPARHAGRLEEHLWTALRAHNAIPSARRVRAIISGGHETRRARGRGVGAW